MATHAPGGSGGRRSGVEEGQSATASPSLHAAPALGDSSHSVTLQVAARDTRAEGMSLPPLAPHPQRFTAPLAPPVRTPHSLVPATPPAPGRKRHQHGMCKLTFKVRAEVNLGETVAIAGNHMALGSFFQAVQLITTPDTYPIWTTRHPITVPVGLELRYKCVRCEIAACPHRVCCAPPLVFSHMYWCQPCYAQRVHAAPFTMLVWHTSD